MAKPNVATASLVVIIMSAIVAIFLSLVDFGFTKIVELIF